MSAGLPVGRITFAPNRAIRCAYCGHVLTVNDPRKHRPPYVTCRFCADLPRLERC